MKILFAPGIGASERDFPEYKEMFGADFEIIRYHDSITLKQHLDRVNYYCKELEHQEEEYSIIGHSLGAHIVYRYVNEYRLKYLKSLTMIGGGPRFVPLNSWDTIFKLPVPLIALVLVFIFISSPILFLIYGWHGMFQRVSIIDLFKKEGITNIKNIYNQTLKPLKNDPQPLQEDIPVLLVRLSNDLLFPSKEVIEAKKLIKDIDEKVIPRNLIHFSHHLDVLISGYIYEWYVSKINYQHRTIPYEIKYAMNDPESISLELEGYSISRGPVIIFLIIFFLYLIVTYLPSSTIAIHINNVTSTFFQMLKLTEWSFLQHFTAVLIVISVLITYHWIIQPSLPRETQAKLRSYPKVSIIVPMRNEERNIATCVESLLSIQYPEFDLILVDGNSDDRTVEIAQNTINTKNHMDIATQIIEEDPLPEGWIGKSWGAHTGQKFATGEYLLFTDADTYHSESSLRESMRVIMDKSHDGISIVGHLETKSFWEKAVLSFFKSLLFIIMGGRFSNSEKTSRNLGIGQYILVNRELYNQIGGHEEIKSEIAEDIHLINNIARIGDYSGYNGNEIYSVRMYQSWDEIFIGLGRNAYESVGGNFLIVVIASLGLLLWRIVPIFIYPILLFIEIPEIYALLSFYMLIFTIGQYFIDIKINADPFWYIFLLPFGVIALVYILILSTLKKDKTIIWKGREYDRTNLL